MPTFNKAVTFVLLTVFLDDGIVFMVLSETVGASGAGTQAGTHTIHELITIILHSVSINAVKLTVYDRELGLLFWNSVFLFALNSFFEECLTLVIQSSLLHLQFVLFDCGEGLVTEILLGVGILIQLKDKFIDLLSAVSTLALHVFYLDPVFTNLVLQL